MYKITVKYSSLNVTALCIIPVTICGDDSTRHSEKLCCVYVKILFLFWNFKVLNKFHRSVVFNIEQNIFAKKPRSKSLVHSTHNPRHDTTRVYISIIMIAKVSIFIGII